MEKSNIVPDPIGYDSASYSTVILAWKTESDLFERRVQMNVLKRCCITLFS